MEKIARTNEAQFHYWIMDKWGVLPTDPRYTSLTVEQIELLHEMDRAKHILKNRNKGGKGPDEAGHERYDDPDFDAEWDAHAPLVTDNIDEFPSEPVSEVGAPPSQEDENLPMGPVEEKWEEV